MKKLKQIWRYYFNVEIRLLKRLKVVITNQHKNGNLKGLCNARLESEWRVNKYTRSRKYTDIFTPKEVDMLLDIIDSNNPTDVSAIRYWWPKGELQPRLDWCDMVINKLKTK